MSALTQMMFKGRRGQARCIAQTRDSAVAHGLQLRSVPLRRYVMMGQLSVYDR